MNDALPDDRLTDLLDELGPAEPPAGFAPRVMARIAAGDRAAGRLVPFNRGGMVMAKKVMLGLAAVAAIVFAVLIVRGFPMVDRGTEGTIGAAKKYQAQQLASGDVKTADPAVQEFLQSDTFDRIAKDPQARALLADASFAAHMRDQAFADAIREADVRATLRDPQLARIFGDAEARAELQTALHNQLAAGVRQASAEAALKNDARGTAIRQVLSREELRNGLSRQAIWNALADSNFRNAMTRADLAAALNSAAIVAALHDAGFLAAIRGGALQTALASR